MTQLISRGLRKAPVKKTRNMCTDERDDEHQGGPVVDLADDQPALDVEARCRRSRRRPRTSLTPLQRHVRAVVDDVAGARDEPEGQERPGQQADDHRVHRDLAEHERPVVGEDLLQQVADRPWRRRCGRRPSRRRRRPSAVGRRCAASGATSPARRASARRRVVGGAHQPRSQKLGPTGFVERCGGDEVALVVDGDLQLRQRALAPGRR